MLRGANSDVQLDPSSVLVAEVLPTQRGILVLTSCGGCDRRHLRETQHDGQEAEEVAQKDDNATSGARDFDEGRRVSVSVRQFIQGVQIIQAVGLT